jgi:plasmid stabilization system protein ParE
MRIIWTKSAVANLENIKNYIAKDSEYYATEFAAKILGIVDKLSVFPRLGREVPEVKREDIREIIHNNYRIMYRIEKEMLLILAVIHAARDLNNIKPSPWEII